MEGFIKVTWQQIVAGAISLIFLGALTFIFTKVDESMNDTLENSRRIQDLEIVIESGLEESIEDLEEQLKTTNSRLGNIAGTQRGIEIAIARLNALLDRLESN